MNFSEKNACVTDYSSTLKSKVQKSVFSKVLTLFFSLSIFISPKPTFVYSVLFQLKSSNFHVGLALRNGKNPSILYTLHQKCTHTHIYNMRGTNKIS